MGCVTRREKRKSLIYQVSVIRIVDVGQCVMTFVVETAVVDLIWWHYTGFDYVSQNVDTVADVESNPVVVGVLFGYRKYQRLNIF